MNLEKEYLWVKSQFTADQLRGQELEFSVAHDGFQSDLYVGTLLVNEHPTDPELLEVTVEVETDVQPGRKRVVRYLLPQASVSVLAAHPDPAVADLHLPGIQLSPDGISRF